MMNKKRTDVPIMKWIKVQTTTFVSPPKNMAQMDAYWSKFGKFELLRQNVFIENEIGAGEFGSVCSGYLRLLDMSKRTIAIKMLKDSGNPEAKVKFLQEASIMVQFNHPKITALVGVVTRDEPVLICLEFMELGSLRNYLKSEPVFEKLKNYELVRMACDVCSAMHYLSESGFIHRDLAARNVLINKNFICKVADFGLSQENDESMPAADKKEKIPIRWTPPEVWLGTKSCGLN